MGAFLDSRKTMIAAAEKISGSGRYLQKIFSGLPGSGIKRKATFFKIKKQKHQQKRVSI
ncbi:MAG: hypothetical protein R6U29_02005 [Desulfosudaceae bacterium]